MPNAIATCLAKVQPLVVPTVSHQHNLKKNLDEFNPKALAPTNNKLEVVRQSLPISKFNLLHYPKSNVHPSSKFMIFLMFNIDGNDHIMTSWVVKSFEKGS